MIRVEWLGKAGYGDIISPIAYCHNLADKTGHHVRLTFHWSHGPNAKTYPGDPESICYRADRVLTLMRSADVSMEHIYDSDRVFERGKPHTNYEYQFNLHNHWWSTVTHSQESGDVVLCPTIENSEALPASKAWKDPVGERWREVMRMFPNAEIVSYKTPFDILVRKLSRCKVFISYHGSCAWVARHLRVPMVIFSSNRKLSDPCFPCAIQSDISVLSNLDPLIEDSKRRTLLFDQDLSQYEYRPTVLSRIQTC